MEEINYDKNIYKEENTHSNMMDELQKIRDKNKDEDKPKEIDDETTGDSGTYTIHNRSDLFDIDVFLYD